MQRFIATKGKIPFGSVNSESHIMGNDKNIRRGPIGRSITGIDSSVLVRKGYVPAGEKIQEELKEMEKREEELRFVSGFFFIAKEIEPIN